MTKYWIVLCPHGATYVGPALFQGLIWVKPAAFLLFFEI